MSECTWVEIDEDFFGGYETGCGGMFSLTTGTPRENKMAYCCYCGKPLKEVLLKENKDERSSISNPRASIRR